MNKKFAILLFALVNITGCASDPVKPTNDSYALTVVKAANMYRKLKDTPLPQNTVSSLNSTLFNVSSLTSGYSNPLPGMSGGAMVGVGLFSMLANDEPEARNSVIAFIPAELAAGGKNPNEVMFTLFKAAFIAAANESGFETKDADLNFKPKDGSWLSKDFGFFSLSNSPNQNGCTKQSKPCLASMPFGPVVPVKSEWQRNLMAQIGVDGDVLLFDPVDSVKYTHFDVMDNMRDDFNELAFVQKLSSHLPGWIYFYIAPNRSKVGGGEKNKVPLVINNGQLHFFVKAQE